MEKKTLKDTYIKPVINKKIRTCRIDADVLKLLQDQVRIEAENAVTYSQLRINCIINGYEGAACLFAKQSKEEIGHSNKFIEYIEDRGGKAIVPDVSAVHVVWKSLLDCMELAMSGEVNTTEKLVAIAKLAEVKGDLVTRNFLNWFLTEQVEEEDLFDDLIEEINNLDSEERCLQDFSNSLRWRYECDSWGNNLAIKVQGEKE